MVQYYYYFINNLLNKIIQFFFFFIVLFHVIGYFNYLSAISEIEHGFSVYSSELGWVNRKHAIAEGPKRFLSKYIDKPLKENDIIVYAQFMGINILSKKIYLKIEKKYIITDSLNQRDKEKVLFFIFKDVSEAFEDFQGKIPLYVMNTRYSSSFSDGDLTGDLISYYSAFNGINENLFINQLNLKPFDDSLKLSLLNNYNVNKKWILPFSKGDIVTFYLNNSDTIWHKPYKELEFVVTFQNNNQY